jgi:hypothetical protein
VTGENNYLTTTPQLKRKPNHGSDQAVRVKPETSDELGMVGERTGETNAMLVLQRMASMKFSSNWETKKLAKDIEELKEKKRQTMRDECIKTKVPTKLPPIARKRSAQTEEAKQLGTATVAEPEIELSVTRDCVQTVQRSSGRWASQFFKTRTMHRNITDDLEKQNLRRDWEQIVPAPLIGEREVTSPSLPSQLQSLEIV